MLNVKEWEKISCFKSSQKKAEVTSLISDKLEYRMKNIIRDQKKGIS